MRIIYYLRYGLMGMLWPSYVIFVLIYKNIRGLFNRFIRGNELLKPIFGEYVITRQDQFYSNLIFLFLGLGIVVYQNPYKMVIDLLEKYEYQYLALVEYLCRLIALWFMKGLWPAIAFVFADELLLKKYLLPTKTLKPAINERDILREEARKKNMIYAGTSFDEKPLFISDDQRAAHVNTIGTPGTGKTESFILPWAFQDICRGLGTIIVDAKGSKDFYEKLYTLHFQKNPLEENRQKIFWVNLGDPDFSNSYNPLFLGSAVELKDRFMGAFKWENEFYKRSGELVLLTILQAVEVINKKITFEDLYYLLTEQSALVHLFQSIPDTRENTQVRRMLVGSVISRFKKVQEDCKGLINNVFLMSQGGLGKIINTYNPDVDLLEVYKQNQIVFFSLPTNLKGETSRAFGKMLLMDLKSTAGYIELGHARKHFFPVFIDEFAEFATEEYMSWLNKSRSSGLAGHMSYQSLGDLSRVDPSFPTRMGDNTNLNVIFRVNDPDTAENVSKMLGTITETKETAVLEKTILTTREGLRGSVREVEEFRVHPNILKNDLRRGQALIFGKQPHFFYGLYNTDFIPNPEKYEEIKIIPDDTVKTEECQHLNILNVLQQNQVEFLGNLISQVSEDNDLGLQALVEPNFEDPETVKSDSETNTDNIDNETVQFQEESLAIIESHYARDEDDPHDYFAQKLTNNQEDEIER